MNPNLQVQKPKIDNNALFAQRLISNPPEYNIGQKVKTNHGIGYISGRVFNEKENKWKYAFNPIGLNNRHVDDVIVYGIVL